MKTEADIKNELIEFIEGLQAQIDRAKKALSALNGEEKKPKEWIVTGSGTRESPMNARPALREKTCTICGQKYQPTSNVQKVCRDCREKKQKLPTK